ncbi:hypothetical protein BG004_002336, partial [Podila humilis]
SRMYSGASLTDQEQREIPLIEVTEEISLQEIWRMEDEERQDRLFGADNDGGENNDVKEMKKINHSNNENNVNNNTTTTTTTTATATASSKPKQSDVMSIHKNQENNIHENQENIHENHENIPEMESSTQRLRKGEQHAHEEARLIQQIIAGHGHT